MSCLTSSYFSSMDNGVPSRTLTRRPAPATVTLAKCLYLLFQFQLPRAELVEPAVGAGNALLLQAVQLPRHLRALPFEPQPAQLRDAVGHDERGRLGLCADFGHQPC